MIAEKEAPSIYCVDVNDTASFNDLDMSRLLVEMIQRGEQYRFIEIFVALARKYEREKGEVPKIDLIFISDDLGTTKEAQAGNLKILKAMIDNYRTKKCINSIIVKSQDENFPNVEPNVFASGVKFIKI